VTDAVFVMPTGAVLAILTVNLPVMARLHAPAKVGVRATYEGTVLPSPWPDHDGEVRHALR
jgi:hypothetical protein